MLSLITIPEFSNLVSSTTPYASGMFTELLPYALAILGLGVGALFIKYIVFGGLGKGIKTLIARRRGGRRRRY